MAHLLIAAKEKVPSFFLLFDNPHTITVVNASKRIMDLDLDTSVFSAKPFKIKS